jgi:hypothetical protein
VTILQSNPQVNLCRKYCAANIDARDSTWVRWESGIGDRNGRRRRLSFTFIEPCLTMDEGEYQGWWKHRAPRLAIGRER